MKCAKCGDFVLPARHETTGEFYLLDPVWPTFEILRPGPPGDPSGVNPVIVGDKCPGLLKAGGVHGDGCRAGRMAVHRCPQPPMPAELHLETALATEQFEWFKQEWDRLMKGPNRSRIKICLEE